MTTAQLSVVIPAHNEASVIAEAIDAIITGVPEGQIELIVVANGCTDATAATARASSSQVHVIDLAEGSKIAALNAGDAAATVFPIAYVDADVVVSGSVLLDLVRELKRNSTLLAAAPEMRVDTSESSWAVRQYYRIWALTSYRQSGMIGSGIYVLTREGRARFEEFPEVIADDLFVQRLFSAEERLSYAAGSFTVRAPQTFKAHLHRSTRVARGNLELAALAGPAGAEPSGAKDLVKRVAGRPSLWLAFPFYVVGYLVPRIRAKRLQRAGKPIVWNRDDTTRTLR